MKFYCDSCNTKYAISDDKVRGKVLKVRCKHCGNIITVRELEAVAKPPRPPLPSAKIPQTNWHFSINGKSTGPMGLSSLKAKYAGGEIGDETYVWHDTFDSWKPVATVAIFAEALGQGFAKKPRFATHAYTGISEVVQAEPSAQRKGVVPKPVIRGDLAIKPELPKETTKAEPAINEERLEKLRAKLSLKKPEIKKLQSNQQLPPLGHNDFPLAPKPSEVLPEKEDFSLPLQSESQPIFPDLNANPIADTMLPDDVNSGFSPMEDVDNLPDFGDAKPKDLFGAEADTYGLDADSDVMHFPDDVNPSLGGSDAPSEIFASSKSLLIELDKIKKTDRKQSILFLLGGFFVFLILVSIGSYMYVNREIEEIVVVEKIKEREAKIIGYSKDEIAAGFVQLDDIIITKDEIEPEEGIPSIGENDPKKPKEKTNIPTKSKLLAKKKVNKKVNENNPEKKPILTDEEALRKKLLAIGSAPIKRPEDMLGTNATVKVGLSRIQAQAGFKKVSRAVNTCRQRHANRSGKELESAKVKISVEVLPTGKVSTFRISPSALRHTAFDSCMKSKKDTWRFAKFGGKPVKINRTFILQ